MNRQFVDGYAAGVVSAIVVVLFGHIAAAIEPSQLQNADPEQLENICAGMWGCGAPPLFDVVSIAFVLLTIGIAIWMAAYGPRPS